MTGAQRLNGGENGWSVSLFLGEEHYSVAHSTADDFQHAQGAPRRGAALSRSSPTIQSLRSCHGGVILCHRLAAMCCTAASAPIAATRAGIMARVGILATSQRSAGRRPGFVRKTRQAPHRGAPPGHTAESREKVPRRGTSTLSPEVPPRGTQATSHKLRRLTRPAERKKRGAVASDSSP